MAEAKLKIAFAGPHVSVQDGGRRGHMRFGVPASGPMDTNSFAIANAALGNPPGAPGIEISMLGLTLECTEGSVSFAVCGGEFRVGVGNETTLSSWSVAALRAGDRLAIQIGPWGTWCYLAFAGRLQATSWLGSVATHSLSGLGGGKIAAGQELTITDAEVRAGREGPIAAPEWIRPEPEPRVVLGPQTRFFAPETIEAFLASKFALTDSYDRMGVSLKGPILPPLGALSIPSEPIVRGAIQVSGDGVASALLADHGTTGGYPKIATMVSADVSAFAQNRPRAEVRFRQVSPEEAVRVARERAGKIGRYLEGVARHR